MHRLQLVSCAPVRANSTDFFHIFTNCFNTMSKYPHYTLREVLAEVFVDEDNDFNPDAVILYQIQESKCAKLVG